MPDKTLDQKIAHLRQRLEAMGRVAVGFSGGVDSTFLLKIASEALPRDVIALTAVGPIHPVVEWESARELAGRLGVELIRIENRIHRDPDFARNPPERCYLCKKALFTQVIEAARQRGVEHVVDGSNVDDQSDYRPGKRALDELGVLSPMVKAGLTKKEIRQASRDLGLPTWDRPAMACLASRFPYGTLIDRAGLAAVERAEQALRDEGFSLLRVRVHGPVARIEVPEESIDRFADGALRARVVDAVRAAGFSYVALDLLGYRTGSLNEVLGKEKP